MQWLYDILLVLPGLTCLCWAVTLLCGWKRNSRLQKGGAVVFFLIAFLAFGVIDILIGTEKSDLYKSDLMVMFLLTFPITAIFYYYGYRLFKGNERTLYDEAADAGIDHIEDLPTNDFPESGGPYEESAGSRYTKYEKILSEFEYLMNEKKIFRQKNLHREDVAIILHTNRTYITRLLHEEYQCSFSDYINRRRIEYALELIRRTQELSQEQLAEKCGFTHGSSFSRTFKQYMGMTFREWQKQSGITD